MESSDPAEFQVEKLYEWFHLNLRTLQHINLEEIDRHWIEENKHVSEHSKLQMPLPPLKYAPQHFLKRGEGNYASRQSKIILLQKLQKDAVITQPKAFEEYGLYASEMAEAYDRIDKKNLNKELTQLFKQQQGRANRTNSITSSIQMTNNQRFKRNQLDQTLTPMSDMHHSAEVTSKISHKRYNTVTQKNEFTSRPGFATKSFNFQRSSAHHAT